MNMNHGEVKNSIHELLKETHSLVVGNPAENSKSQFLRVLEAVFRKNYVRLQAIEIIVKKGHLGSPAMEITRNMVEDVVAIEYMMLKGEEKYAKRFFDFWTVHYYKLTHRKIGKNYGISKEEVDEAEKRYAKLSSPVKKRKNWAGCDVETQLKTVFEAEVFNERDAKVTEIAYTYGSLKSHFNPYDIMMYLHGDSFDSSSDFALRMSLIFAISSQVRFTTRYVDAINKYNGNMDNAHFGKKANEIINRYN